MSAVKKTAKASLLLCSVIVFLFIGGAIYLYVNMNSLLADLIEDVGSDALGVEVTVGDVDVIIEDKKITVSDIRVGNPKGYKRAEAIKIGSIVIAAESLASDLLVFDRVEVNGTSVNLEVKQGGTNLGDIKKYIEQNTPQSSQPTSQTDVKVIVRNVHVRKAQLNPSVMLLDKDLAYVNVPDIHVRGVGERENGVVAQEAVEQVLAAVIVELNKAASHAGFLEGLSLDALNEIGVGSVEVFKKNLKNAYDSDVKELKQGLDSLKGLFSSE
ncbi:MAG: hypothetical protein OEY94_04015 [Alphaproteobacteria bacterium]|nr:hypothetical protein [Alphaproteobacteria bacterium]